MSVSWEGFNISNCHAPPKPTFIEVFTVFMIHNLVFRWPKPLCFNICHNFGVLMVVCCQNSSNCQWVSMARRFRGFCPVYKKQILRRIRDPCLAGRNGTDWSPPKKSIKTNLGFLFWGSSSFMDLDHGIHQHQEAKKCPTIWVRNMELEQTFRSHQRSESKNEKNKNHLIEFNRGCHDALDWRDFFTKNILHHEKNPSSVMEWDIYICMYVCMFCVKKTTVQHLTIKKSGANFLLVFKQGTFSSWADDLVSRDGRWRWPVTRSCLPLINLWCFKVDLVLGVLMLLMATRNPANSPVEGTVVF